MLAPRGVATHRVPCKADLTNGVYVLSDNLDADDVYGVCRNSNTVKTDNQRTGFCVTGKADLRKASRLFK